MLVSHYLRLKEFLEDYFYKDAEQLTKEQLQTQIEYT